MRLLEVCSIMRSGGLVIVGEIVQVQTVDVRLP
jgi:hypothetical protein